MVRGCDCHHSRLSAAGNVVPADPTGLTPIDSVVVTPDGGSYAYSYTRVLSNIHLAEAIR